MDPDTQELDGNVKSVNVSEPAVSVEPPKRRAGRPRKSSTDTKSTNTKVSVKADNIQAAHMIVALTTGCPELAIDNNEAKMLETAVNDFIAAYPELAIISPKIAATITLLTTAVIVYVPRVLKIRARVMQKQNEKENVDMPYATVAN